MGKKGTGDEVPESLHEQAERIGASAQAERVGGNPDSAEESLREQAERIGDRVEKFRVEAQEASDSQVESDVNTLAEAADVVAKRGQALERTLVKTLREENKSLRRWLGGVLVGTVLLVAAQGFQTYRAVFISGPTLERLDQNQKGIDSLVDYVAEVKKAQEQSGGQDSSRELLTNFITILCSSSDPGAHAACVRVGYGGE